MYPANAEVFLPESLGGFNTSRTGHNFAVLARLKTGVSLAQAQIKLDALATHWKAQYQKSTDAVGFPIRDLRASILGEHVTALYVAAAAAVFLLLIATLNASNLWLVRMLNLAQQNHTKMSLGASSSQLVREVLVQSFALSIIAWGLSLLLTKLGLVWLQGALQVLLPRGENIALDLPLATLLLAVSLGVGLICIVLPVLAVQRLAKASEFTRSARGGSESLLSSRTRLMLTSLQTAITVVLLCGCLFLYKSISTLLSVDPGYRIDGLVGATVSIPWQNSEQALAQMQRYVAAMEQIQALPGVKKVALSSGVPLSGMGSNGTFLIETPATEPLAPGDFASLQKRYDESSPEQSGQAQFRVVSKDYFDVFGIPVRFGRSFSAGDTSAQQHVAVISQSLADSVFPGRSPIGQRIQFGGMDGDLQPLQIVGVVGNVKLSALDAPDDQTVYVHLLQRPTHARDASLIAQSDLDPASVEKMMGQILNGAANLPANFSSMRQIRDKSLGIRQPLLLCFVYFVALAIALAALGSFGLTRYNLAQKRLELFLRHALGASQATLLWQQLRSALHPQVLAIGAGLLTAFVLSRALRSKLFDLGAQDPMSLASSGVIMLLVCAVSILLACTFSTRGAQARNPAG